MPASRCLVVVAFAAAATACGTTPVPGGFGAEPMMTVPSKSRVLSVAVRTAPQPPTRGDQSVEYTITDARTGAPRAGLTLTVVPWMPVMLHGTSIVPTVTETKPGTYLIANVDLFMPGLWDIRTTLTPTRQAADSGPDASTIDDYVSPSFEIP